MVETAWAINHPHHDVADRMDSSSIFGWLVLIAGLMVVAGGLVWILAPSIPWLGKLPGDIAFKKKDFDFYLPLTSSALISIFLALLYFIIRFFGSPS